MAYPDPIMEFILDTDTSRFGIRALLLQVQDGKECVIAYGSKALMKEERCFCVTQRELLAVVHFIKLYRHYLFGKRFLIRTDHSALKYLFNFKDPQGQMARWLQVLDNNTFDIKHRAGREHGNVEAMSRGSCRQCGDEKCLVRMVTWSKKKREEEKKKVQEKDAPVGKEEEEIMPTKRRKGHPVDGLFSSLLA